MAGIFFMRRVVSRLFAAFLVLALAAGCSGGSSSPTATATPEPTATTTIFGPPTPTPAPPIQLSDEFYEGAVTVGITSSVPPAGTYVLQHVYPTTIEEIIAVVQVQNAVPGTTVVGRWFQVGLLQLNAVNLTSTGALISQATFTIRPEAINPNTGVGGGRLTLKPSRPLPVDSYLLRVYVNSNLAKTVGFVVGDPSGEARPGIDVRAMPRVESVAASLTDSLPATGVFTAKNVFSRTSSQVVVPVAVEGARQGMQFRAEWYQLGTIQQRAANLTAEGALLDEANFVLNQAAINAEGVGVGSFVLTPRVRLPDDSYYVKVFVDGRLVRTLSFVVTGAAQ